MTRVTIWYEYTQEAGYLKRELMDPSITEEEFQKYSEQTKMISNKIKKVYPDGLMAPLLRKLEEDPELEVTYTNLYMEEYGLPESLLDKTDVLIWWAHIAHDAVPDILVKKIVERVQRGMGFIPLHSAHKSKPFMALLGASGTLKWREDDFCRIWNICPTHPIAAGIPESIELLEEEMYGEPFDIPKPDDNVFISWYRGGEVFRSGCTWTRGYGKIFYFQPGHETSPSYNNELILKIIYNAVKWVTPVIWRQDLECPNALEIPEEKYRKEEEKLWQ